MHADTVVEAHEVWHRCVFEILTWTRFVKSDVSIVIDRFIGGSIFDNSVGRRLVVDILLRNFESTCWSDMFAVAGRDRGDADECAPFVEIGFLFGANDPDFGGAVDTVAVPIPLRLVDGFARRYR